MEKVLVTRVRTVLRGTVEHIREKGTIKIHDFTIDPAQNQFLIKSKPVELTFTEFNIFYIRLLNAPVSYLRDIRLWMLFMKITTLSLIELWMCK